MTNRNPPAANSPPPPAGSAERRARLAAALRENLRKRKAQLRARAAPPADHSAGDGGEDLAADQQSPTSEHT